MELYEIAILVLSLGLGGVLGAVLSTYTASVRVKRAFDMFAFGFQNYFDKKQDEKSRELYERFEELVESISSAESAFAKLRDSLKRRNKR
jgi:small neutral amino acid transporter SnatA (MarC family)